MVSIYYGSLFSCIYTQTLKNEGKKYPPKKSEGKHLLIQGHNPNDLEEELIPRQKVADTESVADEKQQYPPEEFQKPLGEKQLVYITSQTEEEKSQVEEIKYQLLDQQLVVQGTTYP